MKSSTKSRFGCLTYISLGTSIGGETQYITAEKNTDGGGMEKRRRTVNLLLALLAALLLLGLLLLLLLFVLVLGHPRVDQLGPVLHNLKRNRKNISKCDLGFVD